MRKYDVVVVGGGFAGVAAALAAAREGAVVLLLDKGNSLGGAAVNSLVQPFMPSVTRVNGEFMQLSGGIFQEICKKMENCGARRDYFFLEEPLKLILNDMLIEAGVELLYHVYLSRVNKKGDLIRSVVVASSLGEMEIEADYFIDATGDAQMAYLAGCPTVLGREPDHLCQPMTLCFRLGNVNVPEFFAHKEELEAAYKQARETGELMNPREDILVFYTLIPNVLHFNTTRVVKKNPISPQERTEAEIIARKQVFELYEFMKQHGSGLEDSFLLSTASEIGIRESRMIVGEYILTEIDCKSCEKFYDAIAACNYDIDIHNPEGSGTSHYYFPEGAYYTIPYRSLIPKHASNMLVAGRCISSDHAAQASYRIMPTVCCVGEAAGCAVGLAVKKHIGVRDVDIKKLQDTLKFNGAFIGI